jgi:hypothetical protein
MLVVVQKRLLATGVTGFIDCPSLVNYSTRYACRIGASPRDPGSSMAASWQ